MGYKRLFGDCEPQEVLRRFYDICKIPRRSGEMRQISDYLLRFSRDLGLTAEQDGALNVIVKKPASPGCEAAPPLLLQAHMDMVCEKLPGIMHDFSSQPLKLKREGDKVSACGTSLGADDGLGLACSMAILAEPALPHPPLTVVFTSDEETDMGGAWTLAPQGCEVARIINLDAGPVTVCGSGELELQLSLPRQSEPLMPGYECFALELGGLLGGHTGADAMRERGNAITLLNRLLLVLDRELPYQLLYFWGGSGMSSAFPREARALLACAPEQEERLQRLLTRQLDIYREELRKRDPGITLSLNRAQPPPAGALAAALTAKLRQLLTLLPDGLVSLNRDFAGAMESTACLGVAETRENEIYLTLLIRSAAPGKKQYLYHKAALLAESLGVSMSVSRDIPHWRPRLDSELEQILREVYAGYEFKMAQGTLECGIFAAKWPEASLTALAPPYYQHHSPYEYFLLSELEQSWQCLCALLARLGGLNEKEEVPCEKSGKSWKSKYSRRGRKRARSPQAGRGRKSIARCAPSTSATATALSTARPLGG